MNPLRGFQSPLQALERKLDSSLETARIALARVQRERRALQHQVAHWEVHQAQQEQVAIDCLQRQPHLRAHAIGYLAGLQARLQGAALSGADLQRGMQAARAACAHGQRQLATVQALRAEAQRLHVEAHLRRAAREADAEWLARHQHRRAIAQRGDL